MREPDHQYIASLVVLAQQNDSDAFARLYALTYNKVYHDARHYLKDDYLAQDAVQEVFASVLKNIHKLKDPTLFIAWINRIGFHVCFDMEKKQNAAGDLSLDAALLDALRDNHPFGNPESRAVAGDEKRCLQAALEALPPVEYQCVTLKFYYNKKLDEIADALHISKSTVKRYISHAKVILKRRLGK